MQVIYPLEVVSYFFHKGDFMSENQFIIDFDDDQFTIKANSKKEAKILAKAKRIKQGKNYHIKSITNVTTETKFRVI
jgi:uncharacterized phage-like protein YoqJ